MEPVPSTVFGLAAYNGEAHLAEAIESLLSQTRSDLAIVVVDDASTDATAEICARYAQHDSRVSYARNDRQLGLSGTGSGRSSWPGAPPVGAVLRLGERPRRGGRAGTRRLAAELEAHDEAVLAYPLAVRIDDAGSEYPTRERVFDTAGIADPHQRVRCVAGELRGAGELVYGLMRRSAVERSGPFPVAMLADRLFLVRLALEGEFHQVRERLWYRRFRAGVRMSNARQRRAAFPAGAPPSAYVPWWLTHPVRFGRQTSAGLGVTLARESLRTAYGRKSERVRRNLRCGGVTALERLRLRERPVGAGRSWRHPRLEHGADVVEARPWIRPASCAQRRLVRHRGRSRRRRCPATAQHRSLASTGNRPP